MDGIFDAYLREMSNYIRSCNGKRWGELMNFDKINENQQMSILAKARGAPQGLVQAVQYKIEAPFNRIVGMHLLSHAQSVQGAESANSTNSWNAGGNRLLAEAFKNSSQATEMMYEYIEFEKDTNWWLPVINALMLQMRRSAGEADDSIGGNNQTTNIVHAQDVFKKFYQKMIIDRSPLDVSKKMGCLFVIVHLFKIYFRINNLRLCKNLILSVDNNSFPNFELFPKAHTVAYNYFLGRLQMFEEQYESAEESFTYALTHCYAGSTINKRKILEFLIPVMLLNGKYPLPSLLKKYNLERFSVIVEATRNGDLKAFNDALESNQEIFIDQGVFLILEKLKSFVYRNLFRKVYICYNLQVKTEKQNQLELKVLQEALRLNSIEMDVDELECILANLIYSGAMKGYIAHSRCVVLSKKDPFPPR